MRGVGPFPAPMSAPNFGPLSRLYLPAEFQPFSVRPPCLDRLHRVPQTVYSYEDNNLMGNGKNCYSRRSYRYREFRTYQVRACHERSNVMRPAVLKSVHRLDDGSETVSLSLASFLVTITLSNPLEAWACSMPSLRSESWSFSASR